MTDQRSKAERFQQLHHTGKPLVFPNIWDPLGALMLEDLGYPAVATSSSAIALSHGYHDGEHFPFDDLLRVLQRITQTVRVPVTADIEKGYADNDAQLAEHIAAVIDAGVVGINLEDSDKHSDGLVPMNVQVEKIRLVKRVAERKGVPLFVNARVDAYVHGDHLNHAEKLAETLRRGAAYKEAGADCLFPIVLNDAEHIRTIKARINLPLNIMVWGKTLDMPVLSELCVERISMGGSFLKIALQAMKGFAEGAMQLEGTERVKQNPVTSVYVDSLIDRNK